MAHEEPRVDIKLPDLERLVNRTRAGVRGFDESNLITERSKALEPGDSTRDGATDDFHRQESGLEILAAEGDKVVYGQALVQEYLSFEAPPEDVIKQLEGEVDTTQVADDLKKTKIDVTVSAPKNNLQDRVTLKGTSNGTLLAFANTVTETSTLPDDLSPGTNPSVRYITDSKLLRRTIMNLVDGDADSAGSFKIPEGVRDASNKDIGGQSLLELTPDGDVDINALENCADRLAANGRFLEERFKLSEQGKSIEEVRTNETKTTAANAQAEAIQREQLANNQTQSKLTTSEGKQAHHKVDGANNGADQNDAQQQEATAESLAGRSSNEAHNKNVNEWNSIKNQDDPDNQTIEKTRQLRRGKSGATDDVRLRHAYDHLKQEISQPNREAFRKHYFPTHVELFDKLYTITVDNETVLMDTMMDADKDVGPNGEHAYKTVRDTAWGRMASTDGEHFGYGMAAHRTTTRIYDGNPDHPNSSKDYVYGPFATDKQGRLADATSLSDFEASIQSALPPGKTVKVTRKSAGDEPTGIETPASREAINYREKHMKRRDVTEYINQRMHDELDGKPPPADTLPPKETLPDTTTGRANTETSQHSKDSHLKTIFFGFLKFVFWYVLYSFGASYFMNGLSQITQSLMASQNGCWLAYLSSDGSNFDWKCKVRPMTCNTLASSKPVPGTFNGGLGLFSPGGTLTNFMDIQNDVFKGMEETAGVLFEQPPVSYTPCEICGAGAAAGGRHGMREGFSNTDFSTGDGFGGGPTGTPKIPDPAKADNQSQYNSIWYPVWAPVPSNTDSVGPTYPDRRYGNDRNVDTGPNNPLDSGDVSCHGRANTMPLFRYLPDRLGAKNTNSATCSVLAVMPSRSPFDRPVESYNKTSKKYEYNSQGFYNGPFPGTDISDKDKCWSNATRHPSGELDHDCLTTATQFYVPGDTDSAYEKNIIPSTTSADPYKERVRQFQNNIGTFGANQCFQNLVKANNKFNNNLCSGNQNWCSTYCDKKQWPGLASDRRYKMVCVKNNALQALNALLGGILDPLIGIHKAFDAGYLVYVAYFILIIVALHYLHSFLTIATS